MALQGYQFLGLNDPQTKRDTLFGSMTRHVRKTQANLDKGAFEIMPPTVQCNFTVKSKLITQQDRSPKYFNAFN